MAESSTLTTEQLAALGYEFYVTETGEIYAYQSGQYGMTASIAWLSEETAESMESAGIEVTEIKDMSGYSSLPGITWSEGSIHSLNDLYDAASVQVDNIENALEAQDSDTVHVGNDDYSREDAETAYGSSVAYSEEATAAQAVAGEAAAAAKDAESGQTATSGTEEDTGYKIVQQQDGTYTVEGNNTGTVYASGLEDVAAATDAIVEIQAAEKTEEGYEIPEGTVTESDPILVEAGTTSIEQQSDGTYSIIDTTTGEVLVSGLQTAADAQAVEMAIVSGYSEAVTYDVLDDIDTSGLTAEQVASLEAIAEQIGDDLGGTDVTDEAITDWLAQAAEQNSDYWSELFTQAASSFTSGLEYMASGREAEIEQEQENLTSSLEASAVSAADTGTTFSGIRGEAEERLQEEAADIAASSARAYEYSVQGLGEEAEYQLGSEYLEGLELPTDESGEEIYSTIGDVYGSLQEQQDVDTAALAQELEDEAAAADLAALEAEEPEDEET